MNNIKHILIFLAFCFLFHSNCSAQTIPSWQDEYQRIKENNTFEKLPQAKKVSLDATGNYELNIPLLKIPGRVNSDFDLNLEYTPGIRVSDQASIVGLGWNIPIGSIKRNSLARMDDDIANDVNGYYDDYRDNYSISCPGGNGIIIPVIQNGVLTFVLDHYRDWKITYDNANERFIIVTEDGTTYVFGMYLAGLTNNSIAVYHTEHWINGLLCPETSPIMEWKLTAILDPDFVGGGKLDKYDPLATDSVPSKGNWIVIKWDLQESPDFSKKWNFVQAPIHQPDNVAHSVSLMEMTYPYRIITPTHVAEFSLEPELSNEPSYQSWTDWPGSSDYVGNLQFFQKQRTPPPNDYLNKRLHSINLYRYFNTPDTHESSPIKTILFSYDDSKYENSEVYIRQRTTLMNVQVVGNDGNSLPPYNFTYYNSTSDIIHTPQYNWYNLPSNSRLGLFGWYNGIGNYNPDQNGCQGLPSDGKVWNLKTITYPEGGNITFDYESNYYSKWGDGPYYGNGCRLKSQTISDANSNSISYNYTYNCYNKDGTSSGGVGILYLSPMWYYYKHFYNDYDFVLDNQLDSRVLYQEITETNSSNNKKTIFNYSVRKYNDVGFQTSFSDNSNIFLQTTLDLDGSLTSITNYKTVNNVDILSSQKNIIKITHPFGCYTINNHPFYISSQVGGISIYDWQYDENGNNGHYTLTETGYNLSNSLPCSISETNSDGENSLTSIKYALDYSNDFSGKSVINSLITKHRDNTIIEKYIFQGNCKGGAVGKANINVYQSRADQIVLYQELQLANPTQPYDFNASYANNSNGELIYDARYQIKKVYDLYDDYSNILQTTDANGNHTTSLWGYNSALPIAEIKNGKLSEVSSQNFEDGTCGDWNAWTNGTISNTAHTGKYGWHFDGNYDGQIVRHFSNSDLNLTKNYIFSAWVKSSTTKPSLQWEIDFNDNSSAYPLSVGAIGNGDWEKIELPINVSQYSNIKNIYIYAKNGSSTCDWDDFRFYPVHSSIISKTYDQSTFGITSISDANNIPTIIDYDGLQRPIRVKDFNSTKITENSYYLSRNNTSGTYDQSNPNNITTTSYVDASSSIPEIVTKYYDGFGRITQTNSAIGTEDIIQNQIYDPLGRISIIYKPYQRTINHNYDPNYNSNCISYYNGTVYSSLGLNDSHPFTTQEYDTEDRIIKLRPPGDLYYSNHFKQFSYSSNSVNDEVSGYPLNTLYKKQEFNENNDYLNSTSYQFQNIEYIDKFGFVVQKIEDKNGLNLKTNYVNDIFGNVTISTPPNGPAYNSTYSYNTLGELTQKITPDNGKTQYLYDKIGNLRFTQDANTSIGFYYNKYDALNRIIEVGKYNQDNGFTQTNAEITGFPTLSIQRIAQYLYDTVYWSGQRNVHGKLSIEYDVSSNHNLYYSYDDYGRVEWIIHTFPYSKSFQIYYWYDRLGNIIKKGFVDLKDASNTMYTFYTYDQVGRLNKIYTSQDQNGDGRVREADYTYFASGKIKRLQLGSAQGMDYRYNERDWLVSINHQNLTSLDDDGKPQDPGCDGYNGVPGDKFGEVIGYDKEGNVGGHLENANHSTPQFNGNISWLMYQMDGVQFPNPQNALVGWRYSYDGANRLLNAQFDYFTNIWQYTADKPFTTSMTYDANGNFLTLDRRNNLGTNNSKSYLFSSSNNKPFMISNANYQYDQNGNVTNDNLHQLGPYNIYNLPDQITAGGIITSYWYDSKGNRLRKSQPGSDEFYILGVDGQTEAVYDNTNNILKFWNISSLGKNIGMIEKR
jgi:hypothetical protein